MAILQNTDLSILVVDDQESVRLLLAQELLRMGVREVVQAASAVDALEMFAAHKPDIVLLDLILPGMDGLDFLRALRRRSARPPRRRTRPRRCASRKSTAWAAPMPPASARTPSPASG